MSEFIVNLLGSCWRTGRLCWSSCAVFCRLDPYQAVTDAICPFDGRICHRGLPFGSLIFHHQFFGSVCLDRCAFRRRDLVSAFSLVHRRPIWLMPTGLVGSVECGRPAGVKRPLALFGASLNVFSACSTVLASPASVNYSSQASA